MAVDFDEMHEESNARFAELDKLLSELHDCDLGAWDQDFVDDMTKRLAKSGDNIKITALQWEQLERMRKQYGCS